MTYKDNKEEANMKAALEKPPPTYLKKEKEWTKEDWKKNLGFT